MKKILVVAPAWVGDMVMAQTLFKLLRHQYQDSAIDILAPESTRPLATRMSEINRTISFPFSHGVFNLKQRWQLGKILKKENYDWAIVLPNSFKSAIPVFAAAIPKRTGWCGEMRFGLLNDMRYLNQKTLPLMIQRFMALGLTKNQKLPQPSYPSLQTNAENIAQLLNKLNLTTRQPILALCPGAEFGPSKRWLPEYYAAIAIEKIKQGWQVWLFGSPKDQATTAEIQQHCHHQCIDLAGKTQLIDAIDLLALAKVVVTNDSGLMHVAAALQRPLVAIYGSSSPAFTPPLAEQVKIVSLNLSCSPCFKRTCPLQHLNCMRELKPRVVLQHLNELTT